MSVSSTPLNSRGVAQPTESSTPAESPVGTPKQKRSKTRVPPSVRAKERGQQEKRPQRGAAIEPKHTPPALTAKTAEVSDDSKVVAEIVDVFESAIRDRNWAELGDAIELFSKHGFNFHLLPLSDHPDIKRLREQSAIDVLTAQKTVDDERVSLALDLLNMGADWNATDADGDSVLTILRRYVDDEARADISELFPKFRHLFIDREGRPIKAKN